jgi:hypothetical protein
MSNMLPALPLFSLKIAVLFFSGLAWTLKVVLVLGSELGAVFKLREELGIVLGNGVS